MKILCFIDSLGSGGAQRQLVELAKGFKEKKHEVTFLVYHDLNFFQADLEGSNIAVKLIEEPNYLKRILKIRKEIRKQKPDVVLSFLEGPNFMATLAGFPFKKWKLIVGERSANPKILTSFKLKLYRWFHIFADHIVANSQVNLELVKKINPFLKDNKCSVIYNFSSMTKETDIIIDDKKAKTIITIPASYRQVKNLIGVIEGVNRLDENNKRRLLINWYGNKDIEKDEDYIRNSLLKIKEYSLTDVVRINDVSKNILHEYQNSDFVALLSHFEGFPNVICEAMSLGIPIISSTVSDIPIIIEEGINGYLCDPNDIESIKFAFEKALKTSMEQRKIMGKNNLKKSFKLFSKDEIINKYVRLMQL